RIRMADGAAAGVPDALSCVGRAACAAQHIQEEFVMNRSISLPLTLALVLASQLTLGGCNKKEDVAAPTPDTGASAPDMSASGSMSAASTPMDSISSASAVAGSDAASAAMQAASR
ncbi:MAG: hypothetical protein M3N82_12370, partial [Pseudomonadota bacterium]|nr:hypothetical protein [Pseudomonadota bacterium]